MYRTSFVTWSLLLTVSIECLPTNSESILQCPSNLDILYNGQPKMVSWHEPVIPPSFDFDDLQLFFRVEKTNFSSSVNEQNERQLANLANGALWDTGLYVVTYDLMQSSELQDSCSFLVTIVDVESPNIDCPEGQLMDVANPGEKAATFSYDLFA